ncbi:hypothetical protein ACLOJK_039583 [Asimina triloba]
MPFCRTCCRCTVSLVATLGVTIFFLWLSLRNHKPTFELAGFSVPALNRTAPGFNASSANPPQNTTIHFSLQIRNSHKDAGIYYDPIKLSFTDKSNGSFAGNATVEGFYQGHKKTAEKDGTVEAAEGRFWEGVRRVVSEGKKAVFRVDLETRVRLKVLMWKSRRRTMKLSTEVEVNDAGTKSTDEAIEFSSWAPPHYRRWMRPGGLAAAAAAVLFLVW